MEATKAERLMILFESAGPSGLTLNDLVELFDGTKRNGIYPLIHKLIQRGWAEEAGKVTNAARVACPTCGKYPNANPSSSHAAHRGWSHRHSPHSNQLAPKSRRCS